MDAAPRAVFWNITKRYILALVLIACSCGYGWFNLHELGQQNQSTAELINLSGLQRTLSQRIAFYSLELSFTEDAETRTALMERLDTSIKAMARNHNHLTMQVATEIGSLELSEEMRSLYFQGDDPVDGQVHDYIASARRFLASAKRGEEPDPATLDYILTTGPDKLLDALNTVTTRFQAEGEAAIADIERLEDIILTLTLSVLTIEAIFIFHPMARDTRRILIQLTKEKRRASRSAHQFSQAFQMAPHGMALMDEAGRKRTINPALRRLLRYEPEEFNEVDVRTLVHPDDAHLREKVFKLLESGKQDSAQTELRYVTKEGEIVWTEYSLVALRGRTSTQDRYIVQIVDITERKKGDLHRQQIERFEAIRQVTGGIAHEFNNRLSAIYGNLQLVLRDTRLSATTQKRIQSALQQSEECGGLVKQIRAFGSEQALATSKVNLQAHLSALYSRLRDIAGEKIALSLWAEDEVYPVEIDEAELSTAVLAVVRNAAEAMPDGGTISIRIADREVDAHHQLVGGLYTVLSVTDTGPGIPEEDKAKVLQPFFTTKRDHAAVGLGLSAADGFLKQMKGHLGIEDNPGGGTIVEMYFPKAEREKQVDASLTLGAVGRRVSRA